MDRRRSPVKTVMILAGESSGELYGSLLAKALRRKWPDVHIIGIGGSRMKEAGVELIARTSDAFGVVEALSALGKIRTALQRAGNALREFRPQVLIPIDYPDFNLRVAAMARRLGSKVLYYVSPQVWAWRKGRIQRIARLVDKMMVILPFEERLYRDAGVACEFVGHPVVEDIDTLISETGCGRQSAGSLQAELKTCMKRALHLDEKRPLLSILPGSRPSELKRHFPLILQTAQKFRKDADIASARDYQLCVPLAPNTDEEPYRFYLETLQREGVMIRRGESVKVLAASDMAVVASGTATLQAALLEVPMVVIYRLSPLTYQLGKRIVRVKHIALVNILSGGEVVRELLQSDANPHEIIKALRKISSGQKYREDMIAAFRAIKQQFAGKHPSDRVAEVAMEMAGERLERP